MVYMSKEDGGYGCVPADTLGVASTGEEMSRSRQEEAITVLDLSDPKDMAMYIEAGYEIKERCTTTQSQSSLDCNASFDAMSLDMEDMPDLDTKSLGKGVVSHVVKEELKLRIQAKRLQSGKGVTPVCDTPRKVSRIEVMIQVLHLAPKHPSITR